MKIKTTLSLLLLLLVTNITFSQEVDYNNETYTIKDKSIFKDGEDVTNMLSVEEAASIKEALKTSLMEEKEALEEKKQMAAEEKALKAEEKKQKAEDKKQKAEELKQKAQEKREKAEEKVKQKAEKKKKQAEKELKKKQKAIQKKAKFAAAVEKTSKQLTRANDKFRRLKANGDLSPNDETKWLGKIEKLKAKITKMQSKLKKMN